MVRAAAQERTELERSSRIDNALTYERCRQSVQATFGPKIRNVTAIPERTVGTRIEAAYRARRNGRYQDALKQLDEARDPEAELSEIGGWVVRVGCVS